MLGIDDRLCVFWRIAVSVAVTTGSEVNDWIVSIP